MTKRDIVIFLFKWKLSLVGYFLLIVALSTMLVYVLPQQYEAVATILIEGNRAPVMRADVAYGAEQLSVMNSAVAIIRSGTVIQATADQFEKQKSPVDAAQDKQQSPGRLSALLSSIGQWMIDVGLREQTTEEERLIRKLQDGLKVRPQPNSNIITISYTSNNPQLSADVVNITTDNYIQHHLKIYSPGGTSDVYRRQIERLETDLNRQREQLADFKQANSLSALNETKRALVQQQSRLNSEVSEVERELIELRTRFGKGHTRVTLAEQRLESTRTSLEDTAAQLQRIELQELKIKNWEMDIGSIEKSIRSYQDRYQDEQLFSLANTEVVNVLIVERATPPTRPNHSRLFYIVLASLGGILLSLAIALIREYFDRRVTDPEVASRILGIPTLGSIEKV